MRRRLRFGVALAAVLALLAPLASCGGDDDESTAAFCDEVESILQSDEGNQGLEQGFQQIQEALDRLQDVEPPDEISEDWETVMRAFRAEDPSDVDLQATQRAGRRVQGYLTDECGLTEENT